MFAHPHDPSSDEGAPLSTSAKTRAAARRPRILVVEDDALLRESLLELLKGEGYRVEGASNGKQAIELLAPGERIDLVLLDLLLPVKTGWDVLTHLQSSSHKDVPVLVLTGSGLKQGAVGSYPVLAKNVSYDALLETVRKLLP